MHQTNLKINTRSGSGLKLELTTGLSFTRRLSLFVRIVHCVSHLTYNYLSVKWVIMKKIYAMKFLSMSLIHSYHIFPSFEYLNLTNVMFTKFEYLNLTIWYNLFSNLRSTPNKVPLPFYGDHSPFVFNVHSIIIVSVAKDDIRDPYRTHLVKYRVESCSYLNFEKFNEYWIPQSKIEH